MFIRNVIIQTSTTYKTMKTRHRRPVIDLGPALASKRFYQPRKPRLTLWGITIASNLAWITIAVILTTGWWSTTKVGTAFMEAYHHQQEIINEKQNIISEKDVEVARMIAFQQSSPGDVLLLAKKVAGVLNTASGSQRQFLEKAVPEAIRLQVQTGVPASAIISMSIYESGYGKSALAEKYNNFFGIKAFSNWSGPRAKNMPTVDSGVKTRADFRAYPSVYDGFVGYTEFLRDNRRYSKAFDTTTGEAFVREVLRAGYCPDGDYLGNIKVIMARHNLKSLDEILLKGNSGYYQVAWLKKDSQNPN